MRPAFDLVLRGGSVFLDGKLQLADIGVDDERIAAIGSLAAGQGRVEIELHGLTVLPGVIDSQVHFREPGLTHKEDLASGTLCAALGGVTAIFEMPNTNPPTSTRAALHEKITLASGKAAVDFAFFAGATGDNTADLAELEMLEGCAGVKIFMGSSTGSLLVSEDAAIKEVLRNGKRRVAVHCEDEARLIERREIAQKEAHPRAHCLWRDPESSLLATKRLLRLAEETRRPVHVLHVTTAQEVALLARSKSICTAEVTPQHLTLAAPDCYETLGTHAQMNPPIREQHHRKALWQGVADHVFDVVGSDHAPHTTEEKEKPYPNSPSGMPGVQTLLPLMLDHVHAGRLSLKRLVELTAQGPANIYGLSDRGQIDVGKLASFSIVDLKKEVTITNAWHASKCGWTPFDGKTVTGFPMHTIVRGQIVVRDGELIDDTLGSPVVFDDHRNS